MANIINLKEIENRLYFDGTYTPIVCGNSNYYVQIQFSDEWNRCYFKTAVFVVGEKKKQMKFEGSLLRLPAFPNAPSFEMLVYAKDEDAIYSTTAIKIRLEPTPIGNLLDFQFEDWHFLYFLNSNDESLAYLDSSQLFHWGEAKKVAVKQLLFYFV